MEKKKTCNKCKAELIFEMFYKCKTKNDGLQNQCKDCAGEQKRKYYQDHKKAIVEIRKEYYQNNKEIISVNKKEYYQVNREGLLETRKEYAINNKEAIFVRKKTFRQAHKEILAIVHKEYYEANKEDISTRGKEYYKTNKETIDPKNRKYYIENKGVIALSVKKYQETHKEYYRIIREKRRTRKGQSPSTLTLIQWENIKIHFNNRCAYCGEGKPLTQDHFLALSKGGGHTKENIIPVCLSCNCSKCKSDFGKWYPKHLYYNKEREESILKYINNQTVTA